MDGIQVPFWNRIELSVADTESKDTIVYEREDDK